MATRDYWAEAPMNRQQTVLFGPTLDSTIGEDDPVRLFDGVLGGMDWSCRRWKSAASSFTAEFTEGENRMAVGDTTSRTKQWIELHG
jgi:hypothetical protein